VLMQTFPHRGPIGEQEFERLQSEVPASGGVVEKSLVESVDLLKRRDRAVEGARQVNRHLR